MIAMVRGRVVHRDATSVVVDVSGVGYLVHVADPMAVPPIGEEVVLHTSLQVREDSMTLYGFTDRAGLALFDLLLSASGVGPKLALACLATLPAANLRQAIAAGDVAMLTQVPGIGKKVAQRMVLELKDKVGASGEVDLEALTANGATVVGSVGGGTRASVTDALAGLGYGMPEIRAALDGLDVDVEATDEAEVLRLALRSLARHGVLS